MGEKCVCCGYRKCTDALDLHHLNPEEKEFSFGAMRAVARSWNKSVVELRKCVLICKNCHAEVHAEVREIPPNAARFNETFADYKIIEQRNKEASWLPCPTCKKKVPPHKKYCSYVCSGGKNPKAHWKTDWDSVDLRKMVADGLSKRKIAQMLGVSDKTVAKHLQNLPVGP